MVCEFHITVYTYLLAWKPTVLLVINLFPFYTLSLVCTFRKRPVTKAWSYIPTLKTFLVQQGYCVCVLWATGVSTRPNWSLHVIAEKTTEEFCRSFRAKISPNDNQSAEEELQREIKWVGLGRKGNRLMIQYYWTYPSHLHLLHPSE